MGKQEKNDKHIFCILDRSGSMAGLASDVLGGFNMFVKEQRKLVKSEKIKAFLTLVIFDHEYTLVHDALRLKDVPKLTSAVYFARGMTALRDAVGMTIALAMKNNVKDAFFMINTDGFENNSAEYNQDDIEKLIKKAEKSGWIFNFVGSGIDAAAVATRTFGTAAGVMNVASVRNTSKGYAAAYTANSNSSRSFLSGDVASAKKSIQDAVDA